MRRACGSSVSHRRRGKSLSVPQRIAMKWAFHVLMARSALLRRCRFGGTNSERIPLSLRKDSRAAEVSLSWMITWGKSFMVAKISNALV